MQFHAKKITICSLGFPTCKIKKKKKAENLEGKNVI